MQIGGYKIVERLGAGGMGIVFKALDSSGAPVAIKMIGSQAAIDATLHASHAVDKARARDERSRMMLVREARTAIELNHPNIARVFDYGQHEGLLFIVMEFLPGRSLDKIVPIHASIPLPIKLRLIRQICDALEYAHRHGVMHRDVKPANTMVLQEAKLKVLDFGLAARLREPLPGKISFVGTPQYMAPEIIAGTVGYDARIDIWATGVTFYQLLTGKLPFAAPSISEVLNKITRAPLPRLDEGIPQRRALERILDRALAKDPLKRYPSAGDFAFDLQQLVERVEAAPEEPSSAIVAPGEISEESWITGTEFRMPSSPATLAAQPSKTVSMIAGEIPSRRSSPGSTFAKYNAHLGPAFLKGVLLLILCMFVIMISGRWSLSHRWFWIVSAFAFGFVMPLLLAIDGLLAFRAFREKFAEIPRCRKCKVHMEHQSRVTRLEDSTGAWAHAASDCLAALEEDLWEDAAKLLSIHGKFGSPGLEEESAQPLTSDASIRYHLDFYACGHCGEESALLTTEDRDSQNWNPRKKYAGAYRDLRGPEARLPLSVRFVETLRAIRRAAQLAAEPVPLFGTALTLIPALLLAIYFSAQIPQLLRPSGYRASVTITSDPPGLPVVVDGTSIATPKEFTWYYGSQHQLSGSTTSRINGDVYKFEEIKPYAFVYNRDPRVGSIYQYNLGDAWGSRITFVPRTTRFGIQINEPAVSTYTLMYYKMRWISKSTANGTTGTSEADPGLKQHSSTAQGVGTLPRNLAILPTRPTFIVTSEPPGLSVTVDGDWILTPKVYHWQPGSTHTLNAPVGKQVFSRAAAHLQPGPPAFYADGYWLSKQGEHTIQVKLPQNLPANFQATYTAKFQPASRESPVQAGTPAAEKK